MTTIAIVQQNRKRRISRKAQQVLSEIKYLQQEVQGLKLQIARLKESAQAHSASENLAPQSLNELKPRRQPAPGKTAMQMIQGQWPGGESTEQLLAQLKALK